MGVPSDLATTKSSMLSCPNVTVPRTMSSMIVSPGTGTANRHTGARPSAANAASSSGV